MSMDKKLSNEQFRKLMGVLMQDGPRIGYRSPDKWRNY